MLKQYLKYFAVLVTLFVLFTNVGFSVLEKSKDYKEISVCCNVEVLKNNCCEHIETCSTTYTNGFLNVLNKFQNKPMVLLMQPLIL